MKMRRVIAWIGIILLGSMYLLDLVLALIGSPEASQMLKVSAGCTIAIPILLWGCLVLTKNSRSGRIVPDDDDETDAADDSTEEETHENH